MIDNYVGMGLMAYMVDLTSVFINQAAFALQKLAHRE